MFVFSIMEEQMLLLVFEGDVADGREGRGFPDFFQLVFAVVSIAHRVYINMVGRFR